ncbi:MAG: hypothetical protein A4E65_00107 [Syntrophorhabdus sp. PtaU1.Bin153]|nr:MAG: hypothetical protein A4E65_00107 [Syntrophorhabdus sp. PtaU1.Bin153]
MTLPSFKGTHLKQLAQIVADAASHSELTELFRVCRIAESTSGSKANRILGALVDRQSQDKCGNNVGAFLQTILDPARFTLSPERHEELLQKTNEVLAFSALQIGKDGLLRAVTSAATLDEARERASTLRAALLSRKVHQDVLVFCRPELMKQNYFHAVLEASKSVAEKLRRRTGLTIDGADLIDAAFGGTTPKLALNSLRTESEKSEQKGFVNLLKGLYGMFRNVTAHAPKVTWSIGEQDALDLLTFVSYAHRRIDDAIRTPWP